MIEVLSNIRQTYGNIETNTRQYKQYKKRQIKEMLSNIRACINYKTDKKTVSNILQTLHTDLNDCKLLSKHQWEFFHLLILKT